jgi:DNA-binding PadR family transcriptional regulator
MSRRFFKHGELHLVLLSLLSERAMHGYQLMSELSRLFGSRYRPSPGSIYPALEALEVEGLVEGQMEESRTTFSITPAGAEALAERMDDVAAFELRTGVRVVGVETLETAISKFKARLAPLAGLIDFATVAPVLDRAAAEIESRHRLPNQEESQ